MTNTAAGREPVLLVEIDQAVCVNRWGVAPCTAALSTADKNKCFNTRKTCADPANFTLNGTPLTLRFCKSMETVPFTWGAIPCIESVSTTPMLLNPGGASKNSGALGARATVTIKMRDFPTSDMTVDYYQSQRWSGLAQNDGVGYDPLQRGMFWTKWLRRNPYYNNFPIRIREGYLEDAPAAMVTRNYIIEDISGPGADGKITIKAQDIFGMADDDKALCPAKTIGVLDRDISAAGMQINCRDDVNQWTRHAATNRYYYNPVGVLTSKPAAVYINGVLAVEGTIGLLNVDEWGWGDEDALGYDALYVRLPGVATDPDGEAPGYIMAEYSTLLYLVGWVAGEYPLTGGTIRIGDEIITYTAATEVGLICTLSGVTRGTDGTLTDDHNYLDQVQLCYRVADADNKYCWEVAEDLLLNYAHIPAGYIDIAAWALEGTTWLPTMTATALITEPTGVNTLLGELCLDFNFNIWWDERDQEIKFRANRTPTETPVALNDQQNIIADSWSLKSDMNQRASEVWIYYKPKDPTKSITDTKNYSRLHIMIDPALESATMYQEARIKTIFSRWLEDSNQCIQIISRYLSRFQDGAKFLKIRVDAKDRAIWTGTIVAVTMHSMVDAVGLPETRYWQVISAEEVMPSEVVEYNLQNYYMSASRYGYYEDVTLPNIGGYYADINGKLADGSDGYSYQ